MNDLRISRSTIYNLFERKDLIAVKIGGATRIKRTSVEAYIERNTLEAQEYAT
jgi:excisionase family DNA binding protein